MLSGDFAGGPEAREVELGLADETFAEIKSGLEEGDEVILNPRGLLNEKERKGRKEDEKMLGGKPGAPGKPGAGKSNGKGKEKLGNPSNGSQPFQQ